MTIDVKLTVKTNRPQDYVLVDLTGFVWMLSEAGRWVLATDADMHRAREVLGRYLDDGVRLARDGED